MEGCRSPLTDSPPRTVWKGVARPSRTAPQGSAGRGPLVPRGRFPLTFPEEACEERASRHEGSGSSTTWIAGVTTPCPNSPEVEGTGYRAPPGFDRLSHRSRPTTRSRARPTTRSPARPTTHQRSPANHPPTLPELVEGPARLRQAQPPRPPTLRTAAGWRRDPDRLRGRPRLRAGRVRLLFVRVVGGGHGVAKARLGNACWVGRTRADDRRRSGLPTGPAGSTWLAQPGRGGCGTTTPDSTTRSDHPSTRAPHGAPHTPKAARCS